MNHIWKFIFIFLSLIFSKQSLSASQPENSWLGRNGIWYCNDGYKNVGGICEAIDVPENAYALGSEWYCKSGYVRFQEKCTLKENFRNIFGSDAPLPGSISSSLKESSIPGLNSKNNVPTLNANPNITIGPLIRSCAEVDSC